ncbi:MAG: hypothetical protein HZA52_09340 [Planctomycetes bacterium]|nr:hypothetical protein [Planctomycetota bacterium]
MLSAWLWQPFAKLAIACTRPEHAERWYLVDIERGALAGEVDVLLDDPRTSRIAVEYAAFGNAPLIAVRWSDVLKGPRRDPEASGGFITSCDVVTLDGRVVYSIAESEFGWNFERPPHLGRSDPLFGPQYSRLGAELLRTDQSGDVRARLSQTRWVGLAAELDADGATWRVMRVE